jgi:hypothetical protein
MKFLIDPRRFGPMEDSADHGTGIFVRAYHPITQRWHSACISCLTKDSLLRWLTMHGGDNPVAENVVGHLLGHGRLHPVLDQVPALAQPSPYSD